MNQEIKKRIGYFLVVIGLVFYVQQSLLIFATAHRNDFAHLYLAGYLAERGGDFFDPEWMLKRAWVSKYPNRFESIRLSPLFRMDFNPPELAQL